MPLTTSSGSTLRRRSFSSSRRGDWSMNRCGCFSRLVARATRLRLISFVPSAIAPHRDRTAHPGRTSACSTSASGGRSRGRHSAGSTRAAAIRSSRFARAAGDALTADALPVPETLRELVQGRLPRFPLGPPPPLSPSPPSGIRRFRSSHRWYRTGRKRSRRRWTQASWRCAAIGCASRILLASVVYADAPEEHRRAVHRALAEVVEDAEQRGILRVPPSSRTTTSPRRSTRPRRRPPAARLRRRPSSPNTRAVLHQPTDRGPRAARPGRGDAHGRRATGRGVARCLRS